MSQIKQWILLVTPIPALKVLKRETWKLYASDERLTEYGKQQHEADIEAGKEHPIKINHHVSRKKSMIKRQVYKEALQWEEKRNNFVKPTSGFWVKFYLPMPKSWSQKKRKAMAFQEHTVMPDADNLWKIFSDALVKKDQVISDFRVSKFWYDHTRGFIAITHGELQPAVGYMITKWEKNSFV